MQIYLIIIRNYINIIKINYFLLILRDLKNNLNINLIYSLFFLDQFKDLI
jgi:hypothetical protein